MRSRWLVVAGLVLTCAGAPSRGDDDSSWPQWRGPDRSGVARGGPALADSWPADGPPLVWRVEGIPAGSDGGYGSPVMAGGRVYLFVSRRYRPPQESKAKAEDFVLCLDASSGKERWRVPTRASGGEASGTLCVAGGKCYGMGSGGEAFCLDAETGRDVWRARRGGGTHSSFLVERGRAVVLADALVALDAATGDLVWTQPKVKGRDNSAVVWRPGAEGEPPDATGATYLLCNHNAKKEVACVDLATGDLRWTVPAGGPSTVAVSGDTMVVLTDKPESGGLLAYRISPDGGEKLWSIPRLADRGASPLMHGGHAYAVAHDRTLCVELRTGRLLWEGRPGKVDIGSPVLADGKIVSPLASGRGITLVRAAPDGFALLAKAPHAAAPCTSPAIAGGKLFLRTPDGLACYDLRAAASDGAGDVR